MGCLCCFVAVCLHVCVFLCPAVHTGDPSRHQLLQSTDHRSDHHQWAADDGADFEGDHDLVEAWQQLSHFLKSQCAGRARSTAQQDDIITKGEARGMPYCAMNDYMSCSTKLIMGITAHPECHLFMVKNLMHQH